MKGLALTVAALLLMVLTIEAAPVSAKTDCSKALAWPSFAEVAKSAHSIYLVEVTESVDGIAQKARSIEVMRGGAPGRIALTRLQPGRTSDDCPEPEGPYARVGDRLLIAYDGRAADRPGSVDTVAHVGRMRDRRNLSELERLTRREAQAYDAPRRPRDRPKDTPPPLTIVSMDELPRATPTEPSTTVAADVLWSCNGEGSGFPRSVLSGPLGVERAAGDVFDGLRSALETMRSEFEYELRENRPDRLPWLLAFQDEDRALFLVRRAGKRERYSAMYVDREGDTWGFGGYSDGCHIRPLITHGLGSASWRVDETMTPSPELTSFPIEVHEDACANGRPADGRIADPIVEYGEEAITITIAVRPVEGGATCPGNPWTPFVAELDEPIGDRLLLDAGPWPPQQRWPIP